MSEYDIFYCFCLEFGLMEKYSFIFLNFNTTNFFVEKYYLLFYIVQNKIIYLILIDIYLMKVIYLLHACSTTFQINFDMILVSKKNQQHYLSF